MGKNSRIFLILVPLNQMYCKTGALHDLFNKLRDGLKEGGEIREVFSFVDSTKLEAKVDSWRARDKALADRGNDLTDDDGKPTMNNKNIENYSSDPDARYGAKSKRDIWVGNRSMCQ